MRTGSAPARTTGRRTWLSCAAWLSIWLRWSPQKRRFRLSSSAPDGITPTWSPSSPKPPKVKCDSPDAGVRSRCTNGSGRMERLRGAGDRAVKTTVEQTLMRGLATAFPCVRPGLPRSASGRQGRASAPHFLRGVPTEALPPALRNCFCRSKLIGPSAATGSSFDFRQSAAQPRDRSPRERLPFRGRSLS
jgi:hypothetical protein